MEGEYFKNQDEKDVLQHVIEVTTAERTQKTLDQFKAEAEEIHIQIDEIEKNISAATSENDLPTRDLYELQTAFDQSIDMLTRQLTEYGAEHPLLFHFNVHAFKRLSEEVRNDIVKFRQENPISFEAGKNWERKKQALFDELSHLETSIANNLDDIDITKVPPSPN